MKSNGNELNRYMKVIRFGILMAILGFVTYESYMHQILGGGSDGAPSIHALCPFGALESLYLILFSGAMIQRIFAGTFILLAVVVLLAIIFRRSFCGLICPFGALQELFSKLGKKLFNKQFEVSKTLDSKLRYLKYGVLFLTVAAAWKTGTLWMSPYDPWVAYGHLTSGLEELVEEGLVGLIILVISLVGSMLYDRFFCKYLCPMGAVLAIVSKISPNTIKRNSELCIDCGLCTKACPVNIEVAKVDTLKSAECLNCQLCTLSCPVEGALENRWYKTKIKPSVLILAVLVLYFGGIGIAKVSGNYLLLPEPISAESSITAEDIKGYMTLEEISLGTDMELSELYNTLGLPDDVPSDMKMKEIKTIVPDFEVETVRDLVRELQ